MENKGVFIEKRQNVTITTLGHHPGVMKQLDLPRHRCASIPMVSRETLRHSSSWNNLSLD